MTRKAAVPDILITLVNTALHAKQKRYAEQAVLTHLLINAVCAQIVRFTVRIFQKTFVMSKISLLTFVMDAQMYPA